MKVKKFNSFLIKRQIVSKLFTDKVFLFLLLISIIALILRLERIFRDLVIFTFDQGRDFLAVKQIVVDKKLTLIGPFSGLQGVFYGPYWYYFLSIPFIVFKGDPRGASFFLTLISLSAIFYCFHILKRQANWIGGVIFALFLAFSPQGVSASLVAGNPMPIFFILPAAFWFLYKIIFLESNWSDFFLLGFLSSFLFNFQIAFAFFFPFVILLSFLVFRKKVSISFPKFLFLFIGFILPFLPLVLFDLRHDYLISKSLVAFFRGENRSLYSEGNIDLAKKISETANGFFDQALDLFALKNRYLFLLFAACFILSLLRIQSIKRAKKKILFFFFPLVIYLFGLSIYPGPVWPWYVIGIPIFYLFLVTFIFGYAWAKGKIFLRVLIVVYLSFYTFFSINPLDKVKDFTKEDTQLAHVANQKKVVDYIYQDARQEKFSVFVYTPPVYDYIWQYLFWWYGERKYGFMPGKEKKGLFYLIIEPDWERPWGPKGWKETVISVGETVFEKKFPTGIVVEKRFF